MTRETRIALLVGLAFIVLFGLVLGQRSLNMQSQNPTGPVVSRSTAPTNGGAAQNPSAVVNPVTECYIPAPASPTRAAVPTAAPSHEIVAAGTETPSRVTAPVTPPAAAAAHPAAPAPVTPAGNPGSTGITAVAPAPATGHSAPAGELARADASRTPVVAPSVPTRTPASPTARVSQPSTPGDSTLSMHITEPTVTVAAATGKTYKVEQGDTLFKIAKKIYGPGHEKDYVRIANANKDKVGDNFALTIGQDLVIPTIEAAAPTAPVKTAAADVPATPKRDASLDDLKKNFNVKPTPSSPALAARPALERSVLDPRGLVESPAPSGKTETGTKDIKLSELKNSLADNTSAVENPATGIKPAGKTPAAAGAARKYVIRSGDTLGQIAHREMGDKSQAAIAKLMAANSDRIKDPKRLSVGTEIRIPQGA